ncbi:ABC-type multidrug transport system permease subunit [Aliiruegeria haliotis]|uniref:ABC-type multidrug transport system permease subunit n=1 Tax=Aliiruegeria haliotis TaxID=1280846 RepID=A0A2T0RER8_9RHOB|nr:ABC transporter permease [Aliiruegeria haliotis]PRY19600.1 ABC-type multidrug transport system permease subunit [Aliiruegeria haliotis]
MKHTLANIWFIANADVRFALRDRATLLWLVLMPPVFFFFIGNMTAGGFGAMMTGSEIVVEAPFEADPATERFLELLSEGGFVRAEAGEDAPILRLSAPWDGADGPVTATYLAGNPTPTTEFEVLRLHRAALRLQAELAAVAARGDDASTIAAFADEARALTVEVEAAGRLGRVPSGFEQTIPGILVMFTMLVLLTSGGVLLLMEREQGILRRLASAPLSRREIVAGKWLGRMLLALAQIGFAMCVGTLLFGMDWGPSLPAILAVLLGWAAFCASLGLLVGSIGRSQGEVVGLGMLLTMVMAALGGAWWPIEVTPAWMQTLQLAVPAGWTMDAMHRLVSFGDAPATTIPHFAALAVACLAVAGLAAKLFRFS